MKIETEISNRHVHLTEYDLEILFGDGFELTKRNDLSQTGEFATEQLVIIRTPKNEINKVRVLGPVREYTQVEISKTDSYTLGINPPIRNSGELDDAVEITIEGPMGNITKKCCIIATRHIHVNSSDDTFDNNEIVSVKISGEKGGIIDNVYIKKAPTYVFKLHLDTDDGNAFLIKQNDIAEIIRK